MLSVVRCGHPGNLLRVNSLWLTVKRRCENPLETPTGLIYKMGLEKKNCNSLPEGQKLGILLCSPEASQEYRPRTNVGSECKHMYTSFQLFLLIGVLR